MWDVDVDVAGTSISALFVVKAGLRELLALTPCER